MRLRLRLRLLLVSTLNGKNLKGQAIRLNWSKPVILPAQPLVLKTTAKKLPALVQSDLHVVKTVAAPVFEIPAGAVKFEVSGEHHHMSWKLKFKCHVSCVETWSSSCAMYDV